VAAARVAIFFFTSSSIATGTRAVARKLIDHVIMFNASSSCRQTVVIPAKSLYATSLRFPDRNLRTRRFAFLSTLE